MGIIQRSVVLAIWFITISSTMLNGAGSIEKMRVVVQPLASSLPLADINLIVNSIEAELSKQVDYFQLLDRGNIDAVFGEVTLSYEDWMNTYNNQSEVRNTLSGIAADHMIFAEIGLSMTTQEYFLSINVTEIATLEKRFTRMQTAKDLTVLREIGITSIITEIVDSFFRSRVSIVTGINNVKCSIIPKDDHSGFRKEITVNGVAEVQIPYGSYSLTFHKEDFRNIVLSQVIDKQEIKIKVDLSQRQGTIMLDGSPASVNIYLDGDLVKNSRLPFVTETRIGRHSILVKKLGYYDWGPERIRLEDEEVFSRVINMERPPIRSAMIRSVIWPGWGQMHLGYNRKALMFSGAQILSVALALSSQMAYEASDASYLVFKSDYEQLTDEEPAIFDQAFKKAEDENSRRNLYNIGRIMGGSAAGLIWVVANIDTWLSSQKGNNKTSNINIGVGEDGLTLSILFP